MTIKFLLPVLIVLTLFSVNSPSPAFFARDFSQLPQSEELLEASMLMESVKSLYKAGRFSEAIDPAKRALEIRERLLPANSAGIDDSLQYLAESYLRIGDYEVAKGAHERLLARKEQRVGVDDESLAPVLDNLAVISFRLKDFKTTELLYLRALKIKEQKFGVESVPVAGSLFYLGEYYRVRKDYSKALDSLKRAINILGRAKDKNKAEIAQVVTGLQCAARQSEDDRQVKELKKFFATFTDSPDIQMAEVVNGRALSLPVPRLPDEIRRKWITGIVVVKVRVDEEGRVTSASDMCQGPPALIPATLEAAFQARFSPHKVNGVPAPMTSIIQYRYVNLDTRVFR